MSDVGGGGGRGSTLNVSGVGSRLATTAHSHFIPNLAQDLAVSQPPRSPSFFFSIHDTMPSSI